MTDAGFDAKFVVLERGWLSSNNLVILGDGEAAVVDTGYVSHAAQTLALIEAAVGQRPVTRVANTHLHSDHCGGNATLKRRWPDAQLLIPPGLALAVDAWDEVALTYAPTGQQCEPFSHDGVLVPGTAVTLAGTQWQVHSAPGHDTHSVILFHPESATLLSADALWGNGFGVVFPALDGSDAFEEVGHTLALIESLQPQRVIPGHGAPFTDVADALARARSRLAQWQASPPKHALHGVKVLIKYRMLEAQTLPLAELQRWIATTPYFRTVHSAFGEGAAFDNWCNAAFEGLLHSNALRLNNGIVFDCP